MLLETYDWKTLTWHRFLLVPHIISHWLVISNLCIFSSKYLHNFQGTNFGTKFIVISFQRTGNIGSFLVLLYSLYRMVVFFTRFEYHTLMFFYEILLFWIICIFKLRPIYYLVDKICLRGDFESTFIHPQSFSQSYTSQIQIKKILS